MFLTRWDDLFNPFLFLAVAMALFGVAVAAALIPSYRATRMDPVDVLKNE